MLTARKIIGDDLHGITATLSLLTRWKYYYGTLPAIRSAALIIAGSTEDNDQAQQAATLARFVKRSLVYQADPVNSEFVQSPDLLLDAISSSPLGIASGDCDDHVILFVALAESLGIACDVAGVVAPGGQMVNHVIAVAHLDGRPIQIDLCAKNGFQPQYDDLMIVG